MALSTNIQNLATRVATESKSLRLLINGNDPNLNALQTTTKTSLVAAINELVSAIASGGGAQIDDTGTSLMSVWSSSHTSGQITAAVDALVASAPGTLDTLNEIAAALGDDPSFATTITNLINSKTAQATDTSLGTVELATNAEVATGTDTQRAVTPAGVRSVTGDPETNFANVFEAGLL